MSGPRPRKHDAPPSAPAERIATGAGRAGSGEGVTTTLYGIANCDTVKKARARLAEYGIAYDFHDYRKAEVPGPALAAWIDRLGWEALLNRRGTTFRGLPEAEKETLDQARATALMVAHPSLIRRPVVEHGDALLVGFDPAAWEAAGL